MGSKVTDILSRIAALENELDEEFARRRSELQFTLERGRVKFERAIVRRHRALKTGLVRYIFEARLLVMLSAPLIYSLIVPLALLDLCASAYQAVCFPIYRIDKVRRADHFFFDRRHLAYLNAIEKLNCAYCSYANGLISYVREIAGRTEQYWCPIKHARRINGAHPYYSGFADYGDAERYHRDLQELRDRLRTKSDT